LYLDALRKPRPVLRIPDAFSDFRKRDLMDLLERRSVSSTSVYEYGETE
jgi:hypothetical protein